MDRVLDLLTPGNRLVMEVALKTGLRVGDILALKSSQIAPKIKIKEHKTGKRRTVSLPASLVARILEHSAGSEWAFPGRKPDRPRTRQAVWYDVKRAAKAYRFSGNISVHSSRKTYAVELLKKCGDMERVQKALNHGHLETTMLYALADLGYIRSGKNPPKKR